jgi:hypothetical protein
MTEILTPKFHAWHIEQSYAMEEHLRKVIAEVIEQKRDLLSYYILCVAFNDPLIPGVLRTKVILSLNRPPPMLGTVCYFRDNVTDQLTRLWVLPKDIPVPDEYLSDVQDNPGGDLSVWNVEDDAERLGMPIVY